MRYLRNKEIKHFALLLSVLSGLLVSIAFFVDTTDGFFVLLTVLILSAAFGLFTVRRYQSLMKLTEYLRRITSGEHSLDIRDNKEGELSILKNEIYKVTLMLTEYNEELQKEKLTLTNQMAEISHQLKTPLTSMMVMTDLLKNEELPADKRREFTSLINAQLQRIEWLVSSLLKMSKLDAGVIAMKAVKISSAKLIQHALEPLLITMELKEITYNVNIELDYIICDYEWTREAILNILKNAMEHTLKGGCITILVRANPLYSEILISDNGSGIAKEDLPHIFTRFYKGRNASKDSVGIGLAMSYRIIKNQQGDIQVKSEKGRGTTFSIRLYKSVV